MLTKEPYDYHVDTNHPTLKSKQFIEEPSGQQRKNAHNIADMDLGSKVTGITSACTAVQFDAHSVIGLLGRGAAVP